MTPPKISSVSPAIEPQFSVAEPPAEALCSDLTRKCYANARDFFGEMKQYLAERRLARAASIFQKDPPFQLQAKKEDPVDSMWGGVKNLWNNGDHGWAILAGVGATVGTVLVAASNLSCSSHSDVDNTHPEVPDASPPPPTTDPSCDGRRTEIQNATSDPSLKSLVDGITLPTVDLTYMGTPIDGIVDSNGQSITQIQCKEPKAWAKVGDRLFVLTANSISGGYAPATLLVYKINSDNSLTPVKTGKYFNNGDTNAIVFFEQYNPVNMAAMSANTELDILFGAPSAGEISTIDPFSLQQTSADWCSAHGDGGTTGGTGGAGGSDSGTGGTGGTGGTSGDGGHIDGGVGGDAGKMDGGAGEAGSPSDAGAKG